MSENTLPVPGRGDQGLPDLVPQGGPPGPYVDDRNLDYLGEDEGVGGLTFERILLALRRFWWLIALAALLGLAGGFVAYRMVAPVYRAQAQILVSSPQDGEAAPIEAAALMPEEEALIDLLKSRQVVQPVVMEERLFISYPPGYQELFRNFQLDSSAGFGAYELTVSEQADQWTLKTQAGAVVSQGNVGDDIGTEAGFVWRPTAAQLSGVETVRFSVRPPAEVANDVSAGLLTTMTGAGKFINLFYDDQDPELAARIVNGVIARFQTVAQALKEEELESILSNLIQQLDEAEDSLNSVTERLESFRLANITQPGERTTPVLGGGVEVVNPLRDEYFELESRQRALDRQLNELRSIVAAIPEEGVSIPRLQAVEPASSTELQTLILRLAEMRGERRDLLLRYTPQHPSVVELDADIRSLEQNDIPGLIAPVVQTLQSERDQVTRRMSQVSSRMGDVPIIVMREQELERQQERFADLVDNLQTRRTLAQLAFQGSLADFELVSEATVPFTPSSDKRLPMAAMVLGAFVGLGLVGAILLDRTDSRFRYPEDVTSGIGVDVLGMIPRVGRSGSEAEVEEAFRDLRMRLMYAHGSAGPLMVVFSSPGPGEGKTLITANLALAFAKIGRRTLVIDADTRRGDLHRLLGEERGPGLVDYLAGGSDGKIIHRTEYQNLFFMGAGARLSRAPELLAGERIRHLFLKLRERYDVILVDAPPLGAGADAFHLATLTGSMALVLRSGESEKSLVEKKLQALAHLPVRVLGGILNDISTTALKGYGYYSYYMPGYEAGGEDDELGEFVPALGPAELPEVAEMED
ncbi:MAG: polysaccharide biosynthesis tyrosine autokinase [Gemmatimonadota bacterium]